MVVKPLEWRAYPALNRGTRLVGLDCFGNEFARLDFDHCTPGDDIEAFQAEKNADYTRRILSAIELKPVAGAVTEAMRAVIDAARRMPRKTPGPGAAGTRHNFSIAAGVVWALDDAFNAYDEALSQLPAGKGEAVEAPMTRKDDYMRGYGGGWKDAKDAAPDLLREQGGTNGR